MHHYHLSFSILLKRYRNNRGIRLAASVTLAPNTSHVRLGADKTDATENQYNFCLTPIKNAHL